MPPTFTGAIHYIRPASRMCAFSRSGASPDTRCRRDACQVPCKKKRGQRLPTTVSFEYTRKDSNLQPSVPKFLKAFFCVSDALQNPSFYWGFALSSLSQCVAKAAKMRISGGISGGTLKSYFQPPKSRHARRGYQILAPAEPTKKSDARSRIPLSLVPHSLVPCSRLPRTPAADGFSRHGSHRCCGHCRFT